MRGIRLCIGVSAAVLLIAAPVLAQTPLPETPAEDPLSVRDAKRVDRMEKVIRELRDIVFKAQRTGAPVVVQPADTDARMAELAAKVSDLELTLTRLNGSLEATTHDLDQAHRDTVALQGNVKALTERLAAAEQKAAEAAAPPPPPEPPVEAPKASATEAFAKARQLMNGGDYDAAEAAFADLVATYPDNPRAPEANYWWGRTLAVRGDHAKAAVAFIASIRGWPQTAWGPDAVVWLSKSLIARKQTTEACQVLSELPRHYPKAPPPVAAQAAAARSQAKCAAA